MRTTQECQHNAELCLRLASETEEIYAKIALRELAKEFRVMADDLDAMNSQSLRMLGR